MNTKHSSSSDSAAPGGDVEVLRRTMRGLIAEIDPHKTATGVMKLIADELRSALATSAALSAPKQVGDELAARIESMERPWHLSGGAEEYGFDTAKACAAKLVRKHCAAPQPAPQPVEAEGREAVAFVPVHPRNGPLWLETYPAGDVADGRSPHYPRMPLYTTPPPEQPAIELEQFRPAVDALWEKYSEYPPMREEANRLLAIIDGAKAGHEIAPDTAQAASALWEVMDTLARDNYQREYAALNKVRLYLASLTAAKAGRTEGEES